jgi:hypothetical protein
VGLLLLLAAGIVVGPQVARGVGGLGASRTAMKQAATTRAIFSGFPAATGTNGGAGPIIAPVTFGAARTLKGEVATGFITGAVSQANTFGARFAA